MNIKEIIDKERWGCQDADGVIDSPMTNGRYHNASLDRIEVAIERFENERARNITTLVDRIVELETDLEEQCRLNGMGSEREARLLAKITELEKLLKQKQ